MNDVTTERFVGRYAELREISARAASAASGLRQIVVIDGRAGIGKTALLCLVLQQLTGFSRLLADCGQGAAVDQIVAEAGRLSHGLAGVRAPGARSPGALVAALRSMLREAAPLAIALDNAQRIDQESAAEILTALAELRAEALLVIVALRDPWPDSRPGPQAEQFRQQLLAAQDASQISLSELTVAETAQLLDRVRGGGSDEAARRLHRYTGGHPALLAVLLDHGPEAAHHSPADLLGLFDPLVTSILRAIAALPAPSQDLLAAMAVAEEPWPLAVVGSVARVADPFEALEPLLQSGLVEWQPGEIVAPVSIRYPLYRDVIYRSLPAANREVLHARAASFALGVRAWAHRVAASGNAGPTLAAMLEREAERYYAAGEVEQAGTLLRWSAAATSDAREHHRQLMLATRWWLTLRAVDWGTRLEQCLSRLPPSAPRSLVLGLIAEAAGRYPQAQMLLREAGDLAYAEGSARALRADLELAMALVNADLGNTDLEYQLAVDLLSIAQLPPVYQAWAEYHAASAWGRLNGPEAALGKLAELGPVLPAADNGRPADGGPADIDAAGAPDFPPAGRSVRLWARGSWRLLTWQFRDGNEDLARMLSGPDRADVSSVIPLAHALMGYAHFMLGDWRLAEQAVAQALRALSGHAVVRLRVPVHAVASCIEAFAGRQESATRHLLAAERWQREAGPRDYLVFTALAAATVSSARGDFGRMLTALRPLAAEPALGLAHQSWWQPLHVEALIGTGQLVAARQALSRLADLAGTRKGREPVTIAWLDAWLAAASHDDFHARARFGDAAARPAGPGEIPLHRARLEHDYGRYLMSGRNRRAAIGWLLHAHELYSALGARPFADQCARDLELCGADQFAPAGGSAAGAIPAMSARERRVAFLAAEGLTNQEIASELFISVKTVEYHLGKVFAKLEISSRRQLAARLGGP